MTMLTTATTIWGITSAQFLTGYGLLCAVAAIAIWWQWREAIGRREHGSDPPQLGVYELARLGGGPQLAITSALTRLHGAKLLRVRRREGTLTVSGALDAGADAVEQAVFEAVRREPGISTTALRSELREHDVLTSMAARLTAAGLMLDEQQAARVRRLWLVAALLAAVGVARIVAGLQSDAAVGWTVAIVLVVVFATFWLLRLRPLATNRGRDALSRVRTENEQLRRHPAPGEERDDGSPLRRRGAVARRPGDGVGARRAARRGVVRRLVGLQPLRRLRRRGGRRRQLRERRRRQRRWRWRWMRWWRWRMRRRRRRWLRWRRHT